MNVKTKRTAALSVLLIATMLLSVAIIAFPAKAESSQASDETLILSNEAPGYGISALINAGYGDYSIYHILLVLQQDSTPSLSGIITAQFLNKLVANEPGCAVFNTELKDVNSSTAIAISSDATIFTESIYGYTYQNANGVSTYDTNISGVGSFRAVYSSSQAPLTSFIAEPHGVEATYNVFAILYMPSNSLQSPTPTPFSQSPTPKTTSHSVESVPSSKPVTQNFLSWAILIPLIVAIIIIASVLVARKQRSKSNPKR
jgi:hypothetical protein